MFENALIKFYGSGGAGVRVNFTYPSIHYYKSSLHVRNEISFDEKSSKQVKLLVTVA